MKTRRRTTVRNHDEARVFAGRPAGHDLDRAHAERQRLGRILEEAETARALWMAVITQAVDDLQRLFGLQAKKRLTRYEKGRLEEILENHPGDFFRSGRFEAICQLVGVSERTIRRHFGLDDLLAELDAA